jgi:hypothetical protein
MLKATVELMHWFLRHPMRQNRRRRVSGWKAWNMIIPA